MSQGYFQSQGKNSEKTGKVVIFENWMQNRPKIQNLWHHIEPQKKNVLNIRWFEYKINSVIRRTKSAEITYKMRLILEFLRYSVSQKEI